MIDCSAENAARLTEMSRRIRLDALDMALASGSNGSHLGGSLSCVEIMAVLYGEVLNVDPKKPEDPDRDRFIPSKNHCVLAHIPALSEAGFIPHEEILEFQKDGGRLTGYPMRREIGLEYSGGSLGMALSVGIGMALHLRERGSKARVYILMGDGELNEGSVWEGIMAAAHYRLSNLTAIIDRNHLSYDGNTEDVMRLEPLADKFVSFGWHTVCCSGHDSADLLRAFADRSDEVPQMVIADTVKGKGVSFIENLPEWHHHSITQKQYEQARAEINAEAETQ
ncbi:MAG: transketolase [Ruminiclostridium sp.]|nr:transketolase [Ruminiclostridium sp.]